MHRTDPYNRVMRPKLSAVLRLGNLLNSHSTTVCPSPSLNLAPSHSQYY